MKTLDPTRTFEVHVSSHDRMMANPSRRITVATIRKVDLVVPVARRGDERIRMDRLSGTGVTYITCLY
jgi:hypothetical protein